MKEIRIGGVPEHFNLPWITWLELHGNSFENWQFSWQDMPGGSGAMVEALKQNELDAALVLTEAVVHALNNGIALHPRSLYVASPLLWGIFSGAQNPITDLNSFKNKKIAISRMGSGSHLMAQVDAYIRGQEIDPDQWVIVQNLDGALTSLEQGHTDLFFWEKWMTKPFVDAGRLKMLDVRPTPWPCFVLVLSEKAKKSGIWENVLSRALGEVFQVAKDLKTDENTIKKLSSKYHLKEEDAATWISHVKWCEAVTDPMPALNTAAEWLKKLK